MPPADKSSSVFEAPTRDVMPPADKSSSVFECSICLRFLHEPATLACGHSFCRRCLRQCLQRSLKCPECRCDVPWDAQPQRSLALAHALQRLHPEEAAARAQEDEVEDDVEESESESDFPSSSELSLYFLSPPFSSSEEYFVSSSCTNPISPRLSQARIIRLMSTESESSSSIVVNGVLRKGRREARYSE